ncbi:hypothetical protein A2U01_0093350, partial [Trifolium medium]|nr:hypothetical protein [Trifolium medium]
MLVKQDEMSAELIDYRRTLLEEIIVNFSEIRCGTTPIDEGWRDRWDELDEWLDNFHYE